MRKDILEQKDLILKMIENGESKAEMCKVLKCQYDTLNRALKILEIDYAGQKYTRGRKYPTRQVKAVDFLGTGRNITSLKLKKLLLRDNILEYRCNICKITEWNGKPTPLELDHIDGDRYNNNLNNIRLICPNCHAQTETYRGKNIGTYNVNNITPNFNEIKQVNETEDFPISKKTSICNYCKNEFENRRNQKFCSTKCSSLSTVKIKILPDEMKELVWKYPLITVAKMLNVSDKSIKKFCNKNNIKTPPTGYWIRKKD